jgi:hypothetical protein
MSRFSIGARRRQEPIATRPFREVPAADGTHWALFFRDAGGYLLRFPGLGDYRVSRDLEAVDCSPAPGVTDDSCRNTYLTQVLPSILSRRGQLMVHASAVEVDGGAVLFLGDSGRGKSTLAASLALRGRALMSDDGVLVESREGAFHAHPRGTAVRLWADSMRALAPEGFGSPDADTKASIPAGSGIRFRASAAPVRAAFFLGAGEASGVVIRAMGAQESFLAWLGQSFVLDNEDRHALAAHFERVAEAANAITCSHLDFPRRYDILDQVHHAIAARTA